MGVENLEKIFNPKRIAVIGASEKEGSVGAKLLQNLVGVGYRGAVYPVNPFSPTVQGITAYPTIEKIPRKVDLAIVATPAHTVPQIVEECGKAGVSGIVIISAGFKEAGEEGEKLEEEILGLMRHYKMRIVGPNSLGLIRPSIKLNATFAKKTADLGRIAFISQSAALCASVIDWASEAHVGFSAIVSVGSMLDVDFGDLIDYFGSDPQTKSIVLYIESVKHAKKFMSAARGFARAKPIVVVKAGRFRESAEAAICHTGALCGEDAVYEAAFRRAGIIRVEAMSDLFNCAETLAMQPNPKGPNLTIVTNAGGPGIMATDSLIERGGKLTKLSNETIQTLDTFLPPYCSNLNPIDILEEATTDRFRKVIKVCFEDPGTNGFLIIYTPQGASHPVEAAKVIVELSRNTTKPVLTCFMGEDDCWKARSILRKNGIPAFTTPEEAVSTFMYMWNYTQNLELLYETPEELPIELSVPVFLRELLKKALNEKREILSEPEAKQFLNAYKIPTIESATVKSSREAVQAASNIGFPLAMKILAPQLVHKSEAEGVILNIHSEAEVEKFYEELVHKSKTYTPRVRFEGVVLQRMVQGQNLEFLIGSKKDPHFGIVIVFGAGGTATELLKDVAFGFPPLNQVLARRLMEKTEIYELLSKSKERRFDLRQLEEILVKFSQLVIDFPEIKEIDVNPLIVNEKEIVAVDSRIVVDKSWISAETNPLAHLVITPYPAKFTMNWKLKNGRRVLLRPIKPEDEILLSNLFQSFSEETMRFRFFQVIREMPHDTLIRYCNIDYNREIAIVAEIKDKRKRKIIGVARLIIQPGRKSGEFAIVVGDDWQGLGLGSKLVDYMIDVAKDLKIENIYGDVMTRNVRMVRLCTRKGFRMASVDEETTRATLDFKA